MPGVVHPQEPWQRLGKDHERQARARKPSSMVWVEIASRFGIMKVGITGGAGFIGGNLCARLFDDPRISTIRVLDDLSSGSAANVPEGVELIVGSLLDPEQLTRFVVGLDAVVHLAARPSVPRSITEPGATHKANTEGTFNLLEAVRAESEPPYVVLASSSSVYGRSKTLPKREDQCTAPRSPYAASKLAAEAYALAWADSFNLDVLAFRFFNVFGPLQRADHAYAAVVPAFVSAALAGQELPVFGDGQQTRDFTFVGTVVEILADAVARRVTSEGPVNLAFGSRVSLLQLVGAIERELDQVLSISFLDPRPGDVRDSQADTVRLLSLFPHVEPVPLEMGLGQTIGWFRQVMELESAPK